MEKVARITGIRATDVILVGGFGASPYLKQELEEICTDFDSTLRRPDETKSVTAVVQGAVVYGIEKLRHKEVIRVVEVLDSFGVRHLEGPIEWIIKKGDIVLSGQKRVVESRPFWYNAGANSRGRQQYSVYRYFDRKRPLRSLPDKWATSYKEMIEVGVITTGPGNDLGRFSSRSHQERPSRAADELHFEGMGPKVGPVKWRFTLDGVSLKVELFVRETVVGSCNITVELSNSKPAGDSGQGYK
ncbi:hypothetical protein LTR78_001535 [Recurvomyces mirabilis]|uniref:Uncharacterized protein n=1 Tax=Recurvomyces mirabilis TaxID=574656 RepID=A0AAE1C5S2_9PEZI|nr:hypothetical protein LTR78_001535 [Recurvomyces mirabilis]KAK5161513.1 hypothetical protein LTS14_001309 [Recurvomyces mirabilis]